MSGVLAYALHHRGAFHRDSLGAVSEATRIASGLGERAAVLTVGDDGVDERLCASLGRYGAERVFRARAPEGLAGPAVDALAQVMRAGAHRYVVLGGGLLGLEIGAGLAARLRGGVTIDVTGVQAVDGELVAVRAALHDTARVRIAYLRSPGIVVGRPNAFAPVHRGDAPAAVVEVDVELSPASRRARMLRRGAYGGRADVERAEVVVAGGRGLGGPDGFRRCEALAAALGGSVAATRAAVDAGWYPYSAQVGQTGRTVAPRLYIAAGVSGAPQHVAGIRSAEHVVAINSDPAAPIFGWCQLGAVGNANEVLPRLTAAVLAVRKRGRPSLELDT